MLFSKGSIFRKSHVLPHPKTIGPRPVSQSVVPTPQPCAVLPLWHWRELLRVLKKGSNPQEEKSDLHEEKNPQEEKNEPAGRKSEPAGREKEPTGREKQTA